MGRACMACFLVAALTGGARAETWSGEIVEARGRWTADRRTIVTDATLRTAGGERIALEVLGGHVDGIALAVIHGPPRLRPGMRVQVTARAAGDARWWVERAVVEDGGAAAPYVQTVGGFDQPLTWVKGCVLITAASDGTTAVDGEAAALAIARAAWRDAGCSYLELADGGTSDHEVGLDGVNLIKYRDVEWCRPATEGNPRRCHDEGAVALASLFYVDDPSNPRHGEILDADIELNNVNYRLTIDGMGTGTAICDGDIAATLTHELGHVLGLDHVCHGGLAPPNVDHTGAPVPACLGNTDPVITEATMFPYQDCGETKKVTPEADDLAALCGIYPLASDPGACAPPDPLPSDGGLDAAGPGDDTGGGCCDAGRGDVPTGVGLITLALLALRSRPRRRRSGDTVGPCAPV